MAHGPFREQVGIDQKIIAVFVVLAGNVVDKERLYYLSLRHLREAVCKCSRFDQRPGRGCGQRESAEVAGLCPCTVPVRVKEPLEPTYARFDQ